MYCLLYFLAYNVTCRIDKMSFMEEQYYETYKPKTFRLDTTAK